MKSTKFICTKCLMWILMFCSMAGSAIAGVGTWSDISGVRGSISTMAEDSAGVLYAVIGGEVYRQANTGGNWVEVSGGLSSAKIRCLLGLNGAMYAGTDRGVFKIVNGGNAWVAMSDGLGNTDVTVLAVDGNGLLYAGTHGGVFRSGDGANNWMAVNAGLSTGNVTALAAAAGGALYAGTNSGAIFKSADAGASWTMLPKGLGFRVNALSIDASNTLYAGVYNDTPPTVNMHVGFGTVSYYQYWGGDGLFKSIDGGSTWQAVGRTSEVNSLALDASGTLYSSGYDKYHYLFCAIGAEINVNYQAFPNMGADCRALYLGAGGAVYAGAGNGDIFKASLPSTGMLNGAVTQIRAGLSLGNTISLPLLAVDGAGTLYLADNKGRLLKSSNLGRDWLVVEGGLPAYGIRALVVDASGTLYVGTYSGAFKSADGGGTWQALAGLANVAVSQLFLDGRGALYAVADAETQSKLFKKSSDGDAWIDVSNGLGRFYSDSIYAITMDPNGTLYLGMENTGVTGVFKSSNAGASWVPVKNNLIASPTTFDASAFAVAVDSRGTLYVATHQGLFKSDNGGDSWAPLNDGLNGTFVIALVADSYGAVYARTNTSVYKLANSGSSWVPVNSGLPTRNSDGHANTGTLLLDKSGQLYTTNVDGVYQYTPPTLSSLKPRLVNLSGRANTLTADGVAIAGFTISGGNKTVLVTAKGPSLATAGVPRVLANPRVRVMDNKGALIASNDNWADNLNATAIVATQGAPSDANESALLLTLPPGAYTAIMEGVNAGTGNGLVAVDGVANADDSGALTNLSTRAMVGVGDDVLIAGLTIVDGPRKILLTAKGPSLTALGVSGALLNPMITLYDATGAVIEENDDQASAANYSSIVATGKAPSDPREAAILRELQPGKYTLIVRGSGGTQGIALVAVDQVD